MSKRTIFVNLDAFEEQARNMPCVDHNHHPIHVIHHLDGRKTCHKCGDDLVEVMFDGDAHYETKNGKMQKMKRLYDFIKGVDLPLDDLSDEDREFVEKTRAGLADCAEFRAKRNAGRENVAKFHRRIDLNDYDFKVVDSSNEICGNVS